MGWFKLFLSLYVNGSLPLSFYLRGYMVWKMLVEEFQDDCLVLGNLWYTNGMILAISKSKICCMKPSIKFLLKRIYGLKEDVGLRIPRWLFSARQSLICKWDGLNISESPCCPKPSFYSKGYMVWKMLVGWFLSLHVAKSLQLSFYSRGYMVWKKVMVEELKMAV